MECRCAGGGVAPEALPAYARPRIFLSHAVADEGRIFPGLEDPSRHLWVRHFCLCRLHSSRACNGSLRFAFTWSSATFSFVELPLGHCNLRIVHSKSAWRPRSVNPFESFISKTDQHLRICPMCRADPFLVCWYANHGSPMRKRSWMAFWMPSAMTDWVRQRECLGRPLGCDGPTSSKMDEAAGTLGVRCPVGEASRIG